MDKEQMMERIAEWLNDGKNLELVYYFMVGLKGK
nr:MAG TPA: hypothetical protein [Caudoviricetes sp.]